MLLIAISLIAAAQDAPAAATPPAGPARDPNKIRCIERIKTGSRTNFERICHTQAEWDLLKSENRRVVERGQANRGIKDPRQ
jgi:hypothetical protein